MLSSGTPGDGRAGQGKTTLFSLDLSYKHGGTERESTSTSYSADIDCTFGTQNERPTPSWAPMAMRSSSRPSSSPR